MMITLQDLSAYLEQLFAELDFSDYCPNGLQVEGKKEIHRIGFAVSATLAVIEECVRQQVDALLVHHGIFWNRDPYTVLGPKKEKLRQLLTQGISLFAYHLPLDAHPEIGNNWKAARDLGLTDLKPFAPHGKGYIGVKGVFAPRSVRVLQEQLEAYYAHPAHTALGGKETVSSLGLISGGAHRSIELASQEKLDCFVTGSFDEMVWDIAHEQKIHFFALGHHATERVGIQALMARIQKDLAVSAVWIDFPNPF